MMLRAMKCDCDKEAPPLQGLIMDFAKRAIHVYA